MKTQTFEKLVKTQAANAKKWIDNLKSRCSINTRILFPIVHGEQQSNYSLKQTSNMNKQKAIESLRSLRPTFAGYHGKATDDNLKLFDEALAAFDSTDELPASELTDEQIMLYSKVLKVHYGLEINMTPQLFRQLSKTSYKTYRII